LLKPLPHPLLHLLKLLLLKKLKQENKTYCYVNSFKQFRVVGIAFFISEELRKLGLISDRITHLVKAMLNKSLKNNNEPLL